MTEQPEPAAPVPLAPGGGAGAPAGRADLGAWVEAAARELGVDPAVVDVEAVLDLARVAAHGVARPAAPLTTFLAGYALAQGTATSEEIADRLSRAAARWDA